MNNTPSLYIIVEWQKHTLFEHPLKMFCKAGIPKAKAIEFVLSLFPTWASAEEEVTHAAGWAYTHNPFGCDRMKFKSHK